MLLAAATLTVFGAPGGNADYLIDRWTSDNGLPDSSVTAIAQTPDGYLWIGTYNGLARFDGVQFVDFDPVNTPELKHPRIDGLFVDEQGTLWVNTHDGSMTSLRNGVFTREWQGGQVSAVYSRANDIYFALLRGQLVCRSGGGIEHSNWLSIPLAGTTSGTLFRQDNTGILWYVTRDGTLNRIIGTNSEPFNSHDNLNGEKTMCLSTDNRGHLWVGTDKRILLWNGSRFEDETPTNGEPTVSASFIASTANNGYWAVADHKVRQSVNRRWVAEAESWQSLTAANTVFLQAYEDRDEVVWFRQYGEGLFQARPDGSTKRLSAAAGFPDDRVSCWFQDQEGNVWVGVDRGGLVRLRTKKFRVIGTAEGLSIPAVSTVCEDTETNIWIGTFGGGLNRWRGGNLTRFDLPEGAYKANFFSAYPDAQGRLWTSAGREDIFRLEQEHFSQPVRSAAAHGTKALLVDSHGQTWCGRQNGLTCISNDAAINFGAWNGFDRKDIRALAEDSLGNIWIGTGEGGLYKYAGGKFTEVPIKDTLGSQSIWSLLPNADGSLWIGTFRGGLLRLKDGKFTRYTTQDGLPNDIICQLLDDGAGKLWIGSHKGIFYVAKSAFADFDAGKISSLPAVAYGLYDGLPTLECSGSYQPCCWHGRDGTLWFGTVKGLVSVLPDEVAINRRPPPVVIEKILVDGRPLDIPLAGTDKTPLEIPPGKHQVDVHYTALSFAAPDRVRFRYKLAGLDEGWVDADGKRSAHYGPLRPAEYRFQVIACNNDGVWNETGAAINLRMLPFFWQTWWFDLLMMATLVGLIFAAVRFVVTRKLQRNLAQLKQQQAIERERERIARDIHDDLGAGLTQIMLQSALAQRSPQDQTPAHLGQISETAHDLVGAMDEIVWAIDPENDTLDGLVTYVGKFFQEFSTRAGLRCRLDLPAQPPALVLSAEVRHNIFLAVKETLNNVVKHAAATEVGLQLAMGPQSFSFIIKDNGRGFIPGTALPLNGQDGRISSGHGLKNLASRLEKIGGKHVLHSEPGGGTQVELTVMLQSESISTGNISVSK